MNLIDRYVNAVADRLPEKMREDLSKEIRSLIEDTLDDRARQTGKPVTDEDLIVEVLRSFGPPEKMAASYLPTRYLIGPRLLPIFWLIVRIGIGITALVSIILLGVNLGGSSIPFSQVNIMIGKAVTDFCTTAIGVFGNIVFIFAIIELLLPKMAEEKGKVWDPRSLSDRAENDHVSLPECIAGIVFTLAVIILFNFYPQFVSIGSLSNGVVTFAPMLTGEFFKYLPWLNILWALELVKDGLLIRENKWTIFTRWMDIGLHVTGIVVALTMAFGAPIAALPAGSIFASDPTLSSFFAPFIKGFLILIALASAADVIKKLYRMIKN
jgi:hypothetical protein